jgi:hypothetical protein
MRSAADGRLAAKTELARAGKRALLLAAANADRSQSFRPRKSQLATCPGRLRKKYKASSTDIVPLGAPSPGAKLKTLI